MIDSHAHLDHNDFDSDREAAIERAFEAGLTHIVTVGTGADMMPARAAVRLAEGHDPIYAVVGIHPHDAQHLRPAHLEEARRLSGHPKVVGLGETGLDLHYRLSSEEDQVRAFEAFLHLSKEVSLPVVLHIREAWPRALEVLRAFGPTLSGVAHCFTGGMGEARACLDLGLYISIPGVVTFQRPGELPEVVRYLPLDRLLVETDSPYLAPVPHRGRRNEPAYVAEVVRVIAGLRGVSVERIAQATADNARRLFHIPEQAPRGVLAYVIKDSLYLNITPRCNAACRFCTGKRDHLVYGHYLHLRAEPSEAEVLEAIAKAPPLGEVVFCGLGESLLRPDLVRSVGSILREGGRRVRVNTDGLSELACGRDLLPELRAAVDAFSVSLNAQDRELYTRLCPNPWGERGHDAVVRFIGRAVALGFEVTATAVDLPEVDGEACNRLVQSLGAQFRLRKYMA